MRIFGIAITALIGMILFGAQANAEQRNRVIHSGDYDSFRVGPKQGWGVCERVCQGDPRCKAWTFIRASNQCRLKFVAGESVRNNCCISGVKRGGNAGQGSLQRFCSDYAKKAVDAQAENVAGRCQYGGNRWVSDYSPHYQYCLRVSRAESNGETATRSKLIDQCRAHAGNSKQKRCNHFAAIAIVQATTNQRASCGFEGPRWSVRTRRHMRRCKNQNRGVARDETLWRETKIRDCLGIR